MLVSYKAIGRNIRAARKKLSLTQEQTAERLKISPLHYGRLERGERPASLEQLANVSIVLNTPLAQLLSNCVEGESFGVAPENSAQTLGEAIAHVASGCSKETQTLMLSLCESVAEYDRRNAL